MRAAFAALTGEIEQVPSAVSAIKVDGKRAYARVREGEDVRLAARRVTVHELTVRDVRGAEVDLSLRCSSGTYVRAIARDAGAALGVGGHLTALRRTAVGPFGLDRAHTLEQLQDDLALVPIAEAARAGFPTLDLDEQQAADVRVGRKLAVELPGGRAGRGVRAGRRVPRPLRAGGRARPGGGRLHRLTGTRLRVDRVIPVQVWRSLDDVPADTGPAVVTVGNFDGVHLGHRSVVGPGP